MYIGILKSVYSVTLFNIKMYYVSSYSLYVSLYVSLWKPINKRDVTFVYSTMLTGSILTSPAKRKCVFMHGRFKIWKLQKIKR